MAFGRLPLVKPMGLYVAAGIGDDVTFEDVVQFSLLFNGSGAAIGALFNFR